MARVPFPEGIVGTENLPRTRRSLQNCFNNLKGQIISRPGIVELNSTNQLARGQFVFNDNLYQVSGTDLIQITDTDTGAFVVIGTIAGTDNIDTDSNFTEAVIVVKGGALYTLDQANTLTDISGNPNIVPCVSVAQINGRFVYIPADGSAAFFSDVGDAGSVQATSFFDAEEEADRNTAVFNYKNTLYICGTDTIELFRDTGATPNPFQRVTGARINNGVISALLEYNETFMFIGREKDQDFGIYGIGSGIAPKVSNEAVDLALSTYTQSELLLATAARFKWRGYDIATFNLPRHSFGFYGGKWFVLQSFVGQTDVPFAATFINQYQGKYYVAFKDKIGRLEKVNTDYGERITRLIDTAFEQENGDWMACQSVELGISQGFNDEVATVGLAMTRNNVEYSNMLFRELGDTAQYTQKLVWNYPGGLGSYEGFMGMRIYTTQDLDFTEDYLVANLR